MNVPNLPKSWLIHDIIYKELTGSTDNYGEPVYADAITIKNVRYDYATVWSRDTTESKIVSDGVIFIDAVNSSPVLQFVQNSLIEFNGKEQYIKKVIPCYFPQSNVIRHYELEVL